MAAIKEADASQHHCPFNDFKPCLGAKCMAWKHEGSSWEEKQTNNLTEVDGALKPTGYPRVPEGEGWEMRGSPSNTSYHRSKQDKLPPALTQRWRRKRVITMGQCARAESHFHEYFDADEEIPF